MADLLKEDLVAALESEPETLTATLENEPPTLVAILEMPADFVSSLEDMETLDAVLEDEDELVVELGPEQGVRGPRGHRGVEGPQGEPGRDGAPGGALSKVSAGPISGGRAVMALDANVVDVPSALRAEDAERVLGVAPYAVSESGAGLSIVCLGHVSDAIWNFRSGESVFVGARGELTQDIGDDWAFVLEAGVALAPTVVFVDIGTPIYLTESS